MAKCNRCGVDIIMEGTCIACSTHKIDNYENLEVENKQLKDKLHHRNLQIKELKNTIKILGEGLNAIRDAFYDTKQNPQVFSGNVETILNATKDKL